MIRRILAWGPVAVWAAVLFLLSAQREIDIPSWMPPYADKLGHMSVYGVLGALLARARWHSGTRVSPWLLVVVGVLYGASDEIHQIFVPGRDPSVWDLTADAIGTAVGMWTFIFLLRRWPHIFGRRITQRNQSLGHDPNE